jgi:carbon-monoxide dehydrogenase large subunit
VRRFYALDDCGTRINPMVIEGQVHGGLTEAFGIAMGQENYLRRYRQRAGRHADGLLPADRGRDAVLGDRPHRHAIAASSDRRQGRGRKPECRRRPAFSNAVIDAFAHLGVTHLQMPHDAWRVWKAAQKLGLVG